METSPNHAFNHWRRSVRNDFPDCIARQIAILLTIYLTPQPHTGRGLAAELNISTSAITRALDRSGEFGIIIRKADEADRSKRRKW